MDSPSPIEIISIDVPDTVLRKNIQNATNIAARHGGLEEAREKFINALVAENGNAKHLPTSKAAYPGLAKQIIATETGESQILDEVGFVDDERTVRTTAEVQSRPSQVERESSSVVVSPKQEDTTTEDANACVEARDDESNDARVRTTLEDDVGLSIGKDGDGRSSVSPSSLSVTSAVDNSGRHECALSDFSVDKEDYRLTRYGLDEATEDEVQEQSEESRLGKEQSSSNDAKENNVVGQDCFASDSVRCSNTQVLVLVSAMIHNPFEKDAATLILEENGVQGKGEITIYTGESDRSIDKLSLLVQPPVPVPNESSVMIQEIVDEAPEVAKGVPEGSSAVDNASKRDVNLEIDGKYLKSVVNSRKSPRKTKNGQMRVHENEEKRGKNGDKAKKKCTDSYTQSEDTFYKTLSKSSSRTKSVKEGRSSRSSTQKTANGSKIYESSHRYYAPLKGSLDSVIATSDPRTSSRRRSNTDEAFSQKSKSYESIKIIQEACYEESSKADSTSQLITANDLDMQTEEYCSVCCYGNEISLRTEEALGSPSQENFYTLRSNCSSLGDEDSTECDICSSWNLQESTDALDRRIASTNDCDQVCDQLCEVCEICGETIFSTQGPVHGRTLESSSRSLPKEASRIVDSTTTYPSLDDDSFEIENCGLQSGPNSADDRPSRESEKQLSMSFNLFDPSVVKRKSQEQYFIPKDEIAILSSGTRRISRKASLLRKKPEDSAIVSEDKRRYSSVDNLQLAKTSSRNNDKILRPRNGKLIGSADNIRAPKSSRRCKSLQRSADNVRYVDSSTDNLDSLIEGLGREDEGDTVEWMERPNIRDNETVKMILTKHGIKIISEKETAL